MKRFICILVLIWLASASKTRVSLDSLDSESIKFIKTFLDPAEYSTEERQSVQFKFVLNKSSISEGKQAIEANQYNTLVYRHYRKRPFYSEFMSYLLCFASNVEQSNWRESTESCRKSSIFSLIDIEFLSAQKELKQTKAPFITIEGKFSEMTSNFINVVLLEDFKDYVKKDFVEFLPIMLNKALMKAKWNLAVLRLVLHSVRDKRDKIFERVEEIESIKEELNQIEDLREEKIEMLGAIKQKIIYKQKEIEAAKTEQDKQIFEHQVKALEMYRNRLVVDIEALKRKIKDSDTVRNDLNSELIEANKQLESAVQLFTEQTLLYNGVENKVNAMEEDIKTVLKQIESKQKPKKSWFFKWFSRNKDCFKLCGGE